MEPRTLKEDEISSREFAAEPLKVKQLIRKSRAVIVTNRGEPELVILPYDTYLRLRNSQPESVLEALEDEAAAKVDFEIPPMKEVSRPERF